MTRRSRTDPPAVENRKARHDYHLLGTFEAGLALRGSEIKAIREGRVNLRDSYCRLERGEAWLIGAHIGQYSHDTLAGHDPLRPRKLLLHRHELNKLYGRSVERGLTIVPLAIVFRKARAKLTIALARGKKRFDKRETIRRREAERETRAAIKSRRV